MSQAPRVIGKLWVPEKHKLELWDLLYKNAVYSIELIKAPDGRYHVHITFSHDTPDMTTKTEYGHIGMDTNPDGIVLANINMYGQPELWPKDFVFPTTKALHKFQDEFQVIIHPNGFLYIKIPEPAYSRSFRRTYLIGVLAKTIAEIAKSIGKPLALENLDFGMDRLDSSNRDSVIKLVWPPHTSTIGRQKYMDRYGVSVHHAATMVIARRAMGLNERITDELKKKASLLRETWTKQASSPPIGRNRDEPKG